MTNKVWEVMNDLETVTSKIVSAREIIDTVADAIQKNDYDRAETLAMAAYEFLGYYLEEFDEKFKLAWDETVKKQPQYQYTATGEKWDLYDEVLKEKIYYEGYADRTVSSVSGVQYTEEELNAMCDKAASDEEKEKCREYNLREAEYYNKRAELDAKHSEYYYDYTRNDPDRPNPFKTKINYDEAIAAGWRMTDDGIWMPPQETPKKKWILPVEQVHDDYFVSFPDDLLKTAKLKEGDEVNWIDNGDGSYTIVKVTKPLGPDEC